MKLIKAVIVVAFYILLPLIQLRRSQSQNVSVRYAMYYFFQKISICSIDYLNRWGWIWLIFTITLYHYIYLQLPMLNLKQPVIVMAFQLMISLCQHPRRHSTSVSTWCSMTTMFLIQFFSMEILNCYFYSWWTFTITLNNYIMFSCK